MNVKEHNHCRDGLGQFAHLPHYMKIYDAIKAAYGNYQVQACRVTADEVITHELYVQVTLVAIGEDKFSKLLQVCHDALASLLEVCGFCSLASC